MTTVYLIFFSVFCEVGMVRQCTEAQAGIVQDELSPMYLAHFTDITDTML